MRRWTDVAERIAATSRTSQTVSAVAEYLRSLAPDELQLAVTFLTGRPFPERDPRSVGIGWAVVAGVVEGMAGAPRGSLTDAYNASSDLGQAVGDLLAEYGHQPAGAPLGLSDVAQAFEGMAAARGAHAKSGVLRDLLARSDPASARAIVKILSGDLRIGLRAGHVETAIAAAFGTPLAEVQWAGMLTGDLGYTAQLTREGRLGEAELTLFRPLKSMLASPAADEAEVLKRLGSPVWVEDKYDGIRAQLHKLGREVRLFSRDLNDVTSGYPEVVRAAESQAWDGILDGELLAWRDGMALPFLQLQTRLGRKKPSERLLAEVPVIFVAFDVLAHGRGRDAPVEPLVRLPLADRRARLDVLGLANLRGLGLSHVLSAADEGELGRFFDEAQARGNEGLMVKDPDSVYTPGRRGYGWLKLKRALTTLDCVVVGVEVGHGKRHGVLSDYTFAVLDDRPGREGGLATIGKAYSGLTDAELGRMTDWFKEHTLRQMGRFHVVQPSIVVEVAFDVIHRSDRHDSGFALRFPRIARLRPDKSAREVDRLSTVVALHAALQEGGRFRVATRGEVRGETSQLSTG
ncbi:MAG TPA: ATP-dependent DNA ligase [Candidatus Caenarcaniphilales bacterium]|nr:ATP-dependent DNA ligase [Candidatus Caenarcaniphilales bacterium]